jgi:hypothetical protein
MILAFLKIKIETARKLAAFLNVDHLVSITHIVGQLDIRYVNSTLIPLHPEHPSDMTASESLIDAAQPASPP